MDVLNAQDHQFFPRHCFQELIDGLTLQGFSCVGPVIRDGAIVFDRLQKVSELPQGVRDQQGPGHYRLKEDGGARWFSWANGPQALKPYLFPPREVLWQATEKEDGTLCFTEKNTDPKPIAVLGVRACDLAALAIHDAHFLKPPCPDEHYARRREQIFIVAVHCSHPASTCFCASTGDGPSATSGYDIALAELDEGFIVDAGSERGEQILSGLTLSKPSQDQLDEARHQTETAIEVQTRALPDLPLNRILFENLDHPRWDDVAERCLACGNCTSVCPTCFCASENEVPSLDGQVSDHSREWSSCFSQGHSYIHGLTIRPDIRTRYRQWLTHKLGSWIDQYGRSGCVGCGRCIAWCPVGIDLTEEVAAICKDAGNG
ncbi:4Fe-4S dicluster domain-containing protein [Marinobacter sp.]|uniref:4Fe-4S dicluster domain-containing protein n=1 Tax=Marinobacter sp. TaxID=50741 RepID=UPI0038510518